MNQYLLNNSQDTILSLVIIGICVTIVCVLVMFYKKLPGNAIAAVVVTGVASIVVGGYYVTKLLEGLQGVMSHIKNPILESQLPEPTPSSPSDATPLTPTTNVEDSDVSTTPLLENPVTANTDVSSTLFPNETPPLNADLRDPILEGPTI